MLTRTCIQCNKEFTMTESEIRFYKSKRLSLPKRCKECRDANKKTKTENGGQMPKAEVQSKAVATVDNATIENAAVKEKGKINILPLAIGAAAVIALIIIGIVLL